MWSPWIKAPRQASSPCRSRNWRRCCAQLLLLFKLSRLTFRRPICRPPWRRHCKGLAPSPPIGAAPSVVPDDELLPPEGFEMPPFCSASQGGKGARNDAPSLRAGRPLTELTARLPSAHIDQWRVRLDGIAREVRDFMSQTGLSHWRVSPQSSVPADPLPSL